jgi:hypothetical protein
LVVGYILLPEYLCPNATAAFWSGADREPLLLPPPPLQPPPLLLLPTEHLAEPFLFKFHKRKEQKKEDHQQLKQETEKSFALKKQNQKSLRPTRRLMTHYARPPVYTRVKVV